MPFARWRALTFAIFVGFICSSSLPALAGPVHAKLAPLDSSEPTIPGLSWPVTDLPVEIDEESPTKRPMVKLKVRFTQSEWSLFIGNIKVKGLDDTSKDYSVYIPLKGAHTRIIISAYDKHRTRISETRTIDWAQSASPTGGPNPEPEKKLQGEIRIFGGALGSLYSETISTNTLPGTGDLTLQANFDSTFWWGEKDSSGLGFGAFGNLGYHLNLDGVSYPLHGEFGAKGIWRNLFYGFNPLIDLRFTGYSQPGFWGGPASAPVFMSRNNFDAIADAGATIDFSFDEFALELTPYFSYALYGKSSLTDGTKPISPTGYGFGVRIGLLAGEQFYGVVDLHYLALSDASNNTTTDLGAALLLGFRIPVGSGHN